jgi:hypothetical protein
MLPDNFALLPDRFRRASISDREIVVPYELALEAVDILESQGILILGWEGWLVHPDGKRGHSGHHQGAVSLHDLSVAGAASLVRRTINASHQQWQQAPEAPGAQLFYCITPATQSRRQRGVS